MPKLRLSTWSPATWSLLALIVLIPFENAATGLRSALVWLTPALVLWEARREWGAWSRRAWIGIYGIAFGAWLAVAGVAALAHPETDGCALLGATLKRLAPFVALAPAMGALGWARLRARDADGLTRLTAALPALWALWTILTCALGEDPAVSLRLFYKEAGAYLMVFGVVWLKWLEGDRRAAARWTCAWPVVVGGVVATLGVAAVWTAYVAPESMTQTLIEHEIVRANWETPTERTLRAQFPFREHNRLASWLLTVAMLTPLAGAWVRRRRDRVALVAAGGLMFLAMALTGTRGAMIAGAIGLAVAMLGQPRRLAALGLGLAIVVCLMPGTMRRHAATIFDPATYTGADSSLAPRRLAWRTARAMIRERPALGIGYGWKLYERRAPDYTPMARRDDCQPHAHSNLLEMAVETGLIGVALFLAWQAALAFGALRVILSRAPPHARRAAWAVLGLLVALQIFGLSNYSLRRNVGLAVWLAWGVAQSNAECGMNETQRHKAQSE